MLSNSIIRQYSARQSTGLLTKLCTGVCKQCSLFGAWCPGITQI